MVNLHCAGLAGLRASHCKLPAFASRHAPGILRPVCFPASAEEVPPFGCLSRRWAVKKIGK